MYHVYILECKDGSLYTGWTTEPWRRLREHNEGIGAKYTRARLPVDLKYLEVFSTKREAMKREYDIKKLPRTEKIALINSTHLPDGLKDKS